MATTGGTITPSGVTKVERGKNLTFYMTPKSGFAILAVAVDGIQVGPVSSYTFNEVYSDHTIAVAFLQTDAGKKAAEATGTEPQTRKVEKVYKEETPVEVVSENHVVALEDAANGTAGDEFVEEMDLTEIEIPTDEELGIVQETEEEQVSSDLLKSMGFTMADAGLMINNNDKTPILRAAFYSGNLDANAINQFAPQSEVPDYHTYSREQLEQTADEDILPYLTNFGDVMDELMTPGDLYELAEGGTASVNVSLTKTNDTISENDKKLFGEAVGQVPLEYFDLTVMKRVGSKITNIKELTTPMEIVVEIPDEIYKEGQVYSILRIHDGDVSILPDMDDDPKTVTFRTDRFSTYAIAKQQTTAKKMVINFAIGALITFIIALICFIIIMYHHVRVMRERRKRVRNVDLK